LLINGSIQGLNVIHCIDAGSATIKYLAGGGHAGISNQKNYLSGDAEIFGDDR
jgi:hypothetical protein